MDESVLAPPKDVQYRARKQAIDAYLAGEATLAQIHRTTGVAPATVIRLAKRCLELHPDGRVWGYRALVGYRRVREYRRRANITLRPTDYRRRGGLAGAFGWLLEQHPGLKQFLEDKYLKRGSKREIHENRISTQTLHSAFLDECRRIGIHENEYPFAQKDKGLRSLYRYINKLRNARMIESVRARGRASDAQLLVDVGTGPSPIRPARPYQRIEFDGHRIDMHGTIEISTPLGTHLVAIDRLWLLALVDVYSEAVLGYYISLNSDYNHHDVMRCLYYSLIPPLKPEQVIEGLPFPKTGRVPNEVLPELQWTAWDELWFDNAMAHRSASLRAVVTRTLGATLVESRARRPTARPYIERLFGLIEEHVFHRIPGTAGTGPRDPRGEGGAKKALRHRIDLAEIRQLADVAVAEHNHRSSSGLFAHSPMEVVTSYVQQTEQLLRKLPPNAQREEAILFERVEAVVHGNPLHGRRPYIDYLYARYTNDILARMPELIGEKLILFVNPDDLRVILAYLPDGSELGYLRACGAWSRTPHSIETRRHIHRLVKEKRLSIPYDADPVNIYLKHLMKKAQKNRKTANQIAQVSAISPMATLSTPDSDASDIREEEFLAPITSRRVLKTQF
ncbi:MAG: hypothetical protein M0R77_08470 [Gammaproteobacteria bacterium]|nr:hypothetical protein [Gammaproteobacteria bacterium]